MSVVLVSIPRTVLILAGEVVCHELRIHSLVNNVLDNLRVVVESDHQIEALLGVVHVQILSPATSLLFA